MKISLSQFKRFEKQIILKKVGLTGQKKIMSANVLILGLGGLGCPLLTYLAASGVGKIGIVDYDKVEISNLNRQTLFSTSDIGKLKVKQAKKVIYKLNKNIKVVSFEKKLTSKNIDNILKKFDIICDGTDNFKKKGPCYRCFMPSPPDFENNCQTEGIFSPVAGIMGSLQANEVLKCILNKKNSLTNHILIFDAFKTELRKSKILVNRTCINRC